jgi:hypothetical protein
MYLDMGLFLYMYGIDNKSQVFKNLDFPYFSINKMCMVLMWWG